ncbi:MAG TPA: hypothetical protein VKP88_02515 [Candidatus Paceibacterota bacterium]|nr:hypothetical protein [Candidatus Paceibacterota bacterium]
MKKLFATTFAASLLAPLVTLAQFGEVETFVGDIIAFINGPLITFVFALILFFFIWSVFKFFVLGRDREADREEGKQYMIWAIIGLVIAVSVWGLVNLFAGGLGLDDEEIDTIPNVPTSNR